MYFFERETDDPQTVQCNSSPLSRMETKVEKQSIPVLSKQSEEGPNLEKLVEVMRLEFKVSPNKRLYILGSVQKLEDDAVSLEVPHLTLLHETPINPSQKLMFWTSQDQSFPRANEDMTSSGLLVSEEKIRLSKVESKPSSGSSGYSSSVDECGLFRHSLSDEERPDVGEEDLQQAADARPELKLSGEQELETEKEEPGHVEISSQYEQDITDIRDIVGEDLHQNDQLLDAKAEETGLGKFDVHAKEKQEPTPDRSDDTTPDLKNGKMASDSEKEERSHEELSTEDEVKTDMREIKDTEKEDQHKSVHAIDDKAEETSLGKVDAHTKGEQETAPEAALSSIATSSSSRTLASEVELSDTSLEKLTDDKLKPGYSSSVDECDSFRHSLSDEERPDVGEEDLQQAVDARPGLKLSGEQELETENEEPGHVEISSQYEQDITDIRDIVGETGLGKVDVELSDTSFEKLTDDKLKPEHKEEDSEDEKRPVDEEKPADKPDWSKKLPSEPGSAQSCHTCTTATLSASDSSETFSSSQMSEADRGGRLSENVSAEKSEELPRDSAEQVIEERMSSSEGETEEYNMQRERKPEESSLRDADQERDFTGSEQLTSQRMQGTDDEISETEVGTKSEPSDLEVNKSRSESDDENEDKDITLAPEDENTDKTLAPETKQASSAAEELLKPTGVTDVGREDTQNVRTFTDDQEESILESSTSISPRQSESKTGIYISDSVPTTAGESSAPHVKQDKESFSDKTEDQITPDEMDSETNKEGTPSAETKVLKRKRSGPEEIESSAQKIQKTDSSRMTENLIHRIQAMLDASSATTSESDSNSKQRGFSKRAKKKKDIRKHLANELHNLVREEREQEQNYGMIDDDYSAIPGASGLQSRLPRAKVRSRSREVLRVTVLKRRRQKTYRQRKVRAGDESTEGHSSSTARTFSLPEDTDSDPFLSRFQFTEGFTAQSEKVRNEICEPDGTMLPMKEEIHVTSKKLTPEEIQKLLPRLRFRYKPGHVPDDTEEEEDKPPSKIQEE